MCRNGGGREDVEDAIPIPHTQQTETGKLGASRVVWGRAVSLAWTRAGTDRRLPCPCTPHAPPHSPLWPLLPCEARALLELGHRWETPGSKKKHPSSCQPLGFQRPQLLHSSPAPHHLTSSSRGPIQMPPAGRAQSTIVTQWHVSYCNWVSTSSCPNCNSLEEEPGPGVKYRNAGKEEAAARRQPNRNAENYGEVIEREARVGNCIRWLGSVHMQA